MAFEALDPLPTADINDPSASLADPSDPTATDDKRPGGVNNEKVAERFKSRVAASIAHRRTFLTEWRRNVELRIGKLADRYTEGIADPDDIRTELNPDWSRTKSKVANIFSAVPVVQLISDPTSPTVKAVASFRKALNFEAGMKRSHVGMAMEEAANDVVNAAGIGIVHVGYVTRTETVPLPKYDVSFLPAMVRKIVEPRIPQIPTVRTTDLRFPISRVSPADFLWPTEFKGSYFDDADWVGHTSRSTWADAKVMFAKTAENPEGLTPDDKDGVLGADSTAHAERSLRVDITEERAHQVEPRVVYDEIFYWRSRVDPTEKSFSAIWRIVFVHGKDKPVIHEAWKGQKLTSNGKYVGNTKFPVQVVTLTYISDTAIPPSDSSAGRPQTIDLRKSRSQLFQQRDRNNPLRWADVNRIDPTTLANIQNGTWQNIIPVIGNGDNVLGEVARAQYPPEDYQFDAMVKGDLDDVWGLGPNQQGNMGAASTTAAQSNIVQTNFTTRIGTERARFGNFFVNVIEVLAGYMTLYSDFAMLTPPELQALQTWDRDTVPADFAFAILPDSTVQLDSEARFQKVMRYLNIGAKSGVVNVSPLLTELSELSGIDPATVITPPPQPKQDPPNLSMRLSGVPDIMNPVVMAMLIKSGQAPGPQELEAAKHLLQAAMMPLQPPQPPGPGGPSPAGPGGPGDQSAGGPPQPVGEEPPANPTYGLAPKIAARQADMGGQSHSGG